MRLFVSLITAVTILFSYSAFSKTILLSTKGPGSGNPFWASVEQGAKDAQGLKNNAAGMCQRAAADPSLGC